MKGLEINGGNAHLEMARVTNRSYFIIKFFSKISNMILTKISLNTDA
jgi:hypothetical protein